MAKDGATRAKARALYESGQSARSICAKMGLARNTLAAWINSEGWEPGKNKPKLIQKEAEAVEAQAERRGITKAKVLDKVAELIDAQSLAVITTQGAVSLAPMQVDAKITKGKADFMGIQYDVVPDRKTQLAAAQLAADVLGMKKLQVDPSDEFRAFFGSLKAAK